MRTVTVQELKDLDPKEFERQYTRWMVCEPHDRWWEYIIDDMCEQAKTLGISVESTDVHWSISYSQGDGLAFSAGVHLADWMKSQGHDTTYLALYIAADQNDDSVSVNCHRRGYTMFANEVDTGCAENMENFGVFEGLSHEDFDALVGEQYQELDPEAGILKTCESLAHETYKTLLAEYEYLTSEAEFIESCEANETTFELEDEE